MKESRQATKMISAMEMSPAPFKLSMLMLAKRKTPG
jgi:hypothetical protein